jgi:hypothetical protein
MQSFCFLLSGDYLRAFKFLQSHIYKFPGNGEGERRKRKSFFGGVEWVEHFLGLVYHIFT